MKNAFLLAVKSIWINKTRSFLTTLGVIIGVGSVVLLTSIGTGLSSFVQEQFDALGANTVLIYPGDIFGEDGSFSRDSQLSAFSNSKIKMSDVQDVRRIREYVDIVVPLTTKQESVSYRDASKIAGIIGTTYEYNDAQTNITPEIGRFFTKSEEESNKKVAILGFAIADELFGTIDPIGKKVKIGSSSYTVVGVMEESGAGNFGGPSIDTYVYIPIDLAFRQFDNNTIFEVIVKTKSTDNIPESIAAIENKLLEKFKEDEFSVFEQSDILETIQSILGALTVGLGGISGISLVVGGIGIMNIMLVTVTERTREIGLRKALGATPNMIMIQFLIESALLSVLGGTIGLMIAFLGTWAIQSFVPAKITLESVILAFGVSMVVGLVFGAAPARRAANLSPIEALRYE
ncbi:ABC transporter permease [Candidatus Woesebacteria bacterium]|nr:ABC transporter permease [Candidatus Woesebacteria bacterium]